MSPALSRSAPFCRDPWDSRFDFDGCPPEAVESPTLFATEEDPATHAPDPNPIDLHDVRQGALGDCYLMAALAGLANTGPGRALIRNAIVENKDDHGQVVSYTVKLFKPEQPWWGGQVTFHEVQVTVGLEYARGHARTRAAGDGSHEVWPLVIEHAFAQMGLGYNGLRSGGLTSEALAMLTGRQPFTAALSASSYGPVQLQRDLAAGSVVLLETRDANPTLGLAAPHAYVVTAIADHEGQPSVELYNTWGYRQFIPLDQLHQAFRDVITLAPP